MRKTTDKFPKELYKYQSFDNKYAIKNLSKNIVYFTNPLFFNDPYDCYCDIDFKYAKDKGFQEYVKKNVPPRLLEYLEPLLFEGKKISELTFDEFNEYMCKTPFGQKMHDKHIAKFSDENLRKLLYEQFRIFCLSECNDNILMWSHYSKDHSGFCIEYKTEDIISNNLFQLHKVNYIEKMIKKQFNLSNLIKNNVISEDEFQLWLQVFTTKFDDWRYENEWRIINTISKMEKPNLVKFIKPSAIYIGAKTSSKNQKIIKSFTDKQEINIYKMDLDATNYSLSPKYLS